MIRATLRISLPDGTWIRSVSRQFPAATFKLLAGYRIDETAVELGEIVANDPGACAEALRAHPSITTFELLEADERRVLGKYETTDTGLYDFVERSSLPVEFPVIVTDGWYEFALTGTREELDALQTELEAMDCSYRLQSVVSTAESETLLTQRQRELVEVAVREGYYEIPRRCTLTDLADVVGIDKSTASTIVRRAEATVLKWFLTGAETKGTQVR